MCNYYYDHIFMNKTDKYDHRLYLWIYFIDSMESVE